MWGGWGSSLSSWSSRPCLSRSAPPPLLVHEPERMAGEDDPGSQDWERHETTTWPGRAIMSSPRFVGIDVSKKRLDFAEGSGTEGSVSNDSVGIDELVRRLREPCPELVVLEASGGYEGGVAVALAAAGYAVAVVNPRQVRDFARAVGQLAKTDAIDARVLALFAERIRPDPRPLPDTVHQRLTALVARRRQLVDMLAAESNRYR